MSDYTKEQLANNIRGVLKQEVEAFCRQLSPVEKEHQDEIERIRQSITNESNSVVSKALKEALKTMESSRPDGSAARLEDAAVAILTICNELRLPLQLKTKGDSAKSSKKGKRLTKVEMEAALSSILAALPAGDFITINQIAERTTLSGDVVRSAIIRLKREDKIRSNGKRGISGAWTRA